MANKTVTLFQTNGNVQTKVTTFTSDENAYNDHEGQKMLARIGHGIEASITVKNVHTVIFDDGQVQVAVYQLDNLTLDS